jgi:hypothetical protein
VFFTRGLRNESLGVGSLTRGGIVLYLYRRQCLNPFRSSVTGALCARDAAWKPNASREEGP